MLLVERMNRRSFLGSSVAALAGLCVPRTAHAQAAPVTASPDEPWSALREAFVLEPGRAHLSAMLIASHPKSVRRAIDRYRDEMDRSPVEFAQSKSQRLQRLAAEAAAEYLGADAADVALTSSTTEGLALLYNGIDVRPGQELLTSRHDHYVTRASLEYRARRGGARLRITRLYDGSPGQLEALTEAALAERVLARVRPATRVLALTWVHSCTGVKLPIRRIADGVRELNERRAPEDRVLVCVDGVHGFGVEPEPAAELGCDFFSAGAHKWLFGPRGTGVLWGRPETQDTVTPTIPAFRFGDGWGPRMSPGGYKAFEHLWGLTEAFALHRQLGRERVSARTRELCGQLKRELAAVRGVELVTPTSPAVSSGIVCFTVGELPADETVKRLRAHGVIATASPYRPSYARLTPSIVNTADELQRAVDAVRAIARNA